MKVPILLQTPVGRQREHCDRGSADQVQHVEAQRYSPPEPLRPYVEYFWTWRGHDEGLVTLKLLANGVSGIIVQHHDGGSGLMRASEPQSSTNARVPNAFVYGRRTRPAQLLARGALELTGAVLRPQALRAFLKGNPAEVNNGPVNLDDLADRTVSDQLLNVQTASERIDALGRCVARRLTDEPSGDLLVGESLQLLRTIRIPDVLKHLRISERQFERRFKKAIGLSPHRYLRILRFAEAVRLMKREHFANMAALASELWYSDQSHFIKEVKLLSGDTPMALLAAVRTSTNLPCALVLSSPNGT